MSTNPPPRRNKRRRRRKISPTPILSLPYKLMWAAIGLFLTIGGTFMEASSSTLPWNWSEQGVQTYSLGVSFQVGAVLLVGCLGGKQAGALSQIAYVLLGLLWFPIFTQGGGLDYAVSPPFGYILGFIPGAWVCGSFAFRTKPALESLAFSCLCGLFVIHFTGILYAIALHLFGFIEGGLPVFWQGFVTYSVSLFLGQLAIVCAVAVLAFALRRIMFY